LRETTRSTPADRRPRKRISRAYLRSMLQCQRIGRQLIEGPNYFSPPRRIDHFGWLEPVLSVVELPPGVDKDGHSWSVYTDETINRGSNFLAPVIRFTNWNRCHEQAVRRVRKWPVITVYQHVLSDAEQREIDVLLRALDQSLSNIEFYEAGLVADRETPIQCYLSSDRPTWNWDRFLTIMRSNACQRIEFSLGEFGVDNKHVEAVARAVSGYIEQLCVSSPSPVPYRERYDADSRATDGQQRKWFFRPLGPSHE
jgi:hypothetical protein